VIDTDYFGDVSVRGTKPYEGGNTGPLYTTGAVTNINEFHDFVTKGSYANETVPASVRSNLTAILGREVAYTKEEITWDGLLRSGKKLELELKGLKA
jgi:hypothetical protein